MLGWARGLLQRPANRPDALFQPPEEVQRRRDTIDDLIEGDRARVGPGKRAVLLAANAAIAVGALGGQNLVQIQKVWGAEDVYAGPQRSPKPAAD